MKANETSFLSRSPNPASLPRGTDMGERVKALQLLLKQMRGATRWSDGTRIMEGPVLAKFRGRIVDELIEKRRKLHTPEPRGLTLTAMSWRNFREIARMAARFSRTHPGKGSDLANSTGAVHTLTATLLLCVRTNDPGSRNRARIVRRALRRNFPHEFSTLPLAMRCNTQQELDRIRFSIDIKGGLVTRRDCRVYGLDIPKGLPARLDDQSRPYVLIGDRDRIHLGMDMVRPARRRERLAARKPGRAEEPAANLPSP